MFLLYHAYVYLEFLILACTIYILATARSVRLPEGQWRCVGLGETEGDVLNGGRDVILGENEGLVVLKRV